MSPTPTSGVTVTGARQREAWATRQPPPVEEVRPDLWSIPVPMGDNPLRYSLAYAFLGTDGLVLVDPGWPSRESYAALSAGLAAAGRAVEDVTGVLVTHAHHDHYGLAHRVRAVSGAWVRLHDADAALLTSTGDDHDAVLESRRAWLRWCGATHEESLDHGGSTELIRLSAVTSGPTDGLGPHEAFRVGRFVIEAVPTPGHSPGHTVFHERTERVLLSGDHVLPRITPNISAFVGHDEDVLGLYLASIAAVRDLDVAEVLPGHEYRFTGLSARADEILRHHDERLTEVHDVLLSRVASTPWEVSGRLTWSRPWSDLTSFSRRAAVGETLAHLRLLRARGLAVLDATDPVPRWAAVAAS